MRIVTLSIIMPIVCLLAGTVTAQSAPQTIAGISVAEYSADVRATLQEFYDRFDTARVMLAKANEELNDMFKTSNIAASLLAQLASGNKVSATKTFDMDAYKKKWAPKIRGWLKSQLSLLKRVEKLVAESRLLSRFRDAMRECEKAIDDWEKKTDAASSRN